MLGFLGDLLGLNSGDPTIEAAGKNRTVVQDYGQQANNLIDTGATQAGGYLGQVNDLYSPLSQLGQKAGVMYGNALGLNGPQGNADATAAFQSAPGYQFTLDQGLQALDRGASSRGMLGSGNLSADTLKYATGLANQGYSDWLGNLGNPNSSIGSALGSQTGALNNLANLATGTATAKTGIAGEVASGLTGANNQNASGETANKNGLASLGSTLLGGAGKIFGYGGF